MDKISDISLFSRVVACGNLSSAARDLDISTAAISKRLVRLEERLGVRLLSRTTRGASPTEAGLAYYKHCVNILRDIEEAETEISCGDAKPVGTLNVVAPIAFGRQHIAMHVPEFLIRYPKVRLNLRLTARTVDFVVSQCDIWIRIGNLKDSRLIASKLAPNRRILCASPLYLERYGEPQTIQDLKNHNCLIIDRPDTRSEQWQFIGPNGPEFVLVNGNVRSNDGEVIKHCALSGIGIAVKSTWDVGALLNQGKLRRVLETYESPATNIYALTLSSRRRASRIRVFIDFLQEKFSPTPYWDLP
jgi:DNA-binding transcriptional LysR family regulator